MTTYEIPRPINVHKLTASNWPQAFYKMVEGPGWWGPSRPCPYFSITERWKRAWHVLTGRADALYWDFPHQGGRAAENDNVTPDQLLDNPEVDRALWAYIVAYMARDDDAYMIAKRDLIATISAELERHRSGTEPGAVPSSRDSNGEPTR